MNDNTPILRVSLAFGSGTDAQLKERANGVILNMTGNASFPTPTVPLAELQTAVTDFVAAMAAMVQGGTAATATKNNLRATLIELLKAQAFYVQVTSANDLAVLLSSGFEAVSTNRTRGPLATPVIQKLVTGQTGELVVSVRAIRNARGYQVELAELVGETMGPWMNGGFHSGSRRMLLADLTPGKVYVVRVRAMGGTTGSSDWSSTGSRICA
ncbi:fibronectin type III domain-containing protein [Luteolibacter marinus]|uniref:fibronectin type III domain-containing protein n=1 Tax=Luteolibacter marinus TaxID=2776705 RepID=UPI0018668FA1|nr:fibronectin type III domain-containing protein [Luteolibacter marinus]